MTSRDDTLERTLRSWMAAEARPDGALEMHTVAVDQARRRRQRPTWLVALRRTTWDGAGGTTRSMPRVRSVIVAAMLVGVAVGVAIIASGGFRSDRSVFMPAPSAAPSPSPSTSGRPAPTPRATPPVDLPPPLQSRQPLNETIVAYLAEHGQSVTPVPAALPDAFIWAARRNLPMGGFGGTDYHYAIVTCVDPVKGCVEVGSTVPGDQRGIWFMDNGTSIRAVDAVTLEHILIKGY
jgi:hypothetical protein